MVEQCDSVTSDVYPISSNKEPSLFTSYIPFQLIVCSDIYIVLVFFLLSDESFIYY